MFPMLIKFECVQLRLMSSITNDRSDTTCSKKGHSPGFLFISSG